MFNLILDRCCRVLEAAIAEDGEGEGLGLPGRGERRGVRPVQDRAPRCRG